MEYSNPEDHSFGQLVNGSWTGIPQEVVSGRAHFAVSVTSANYELSQVGVHCSQQLRDAHDAYDPVDPVDPIDPIDRCPQTPWGST